MRITASAIILYTGDGKILLQHRTKDAPTFPDHWGFFGGAIEGDETPEQAVKRESIEELNYALNAPRLVTTHDFTYAGTERTLFVFVEKYNGTRFAQAEGQGLGWFSPNESKALKMPAHDHVIIERVKAILDNLKWAG